MTDRISIGQMYPNRIPPSVHSKSLPQSNSSTQAGTKTFQQIFNEKILRFSNHAEQRLQQRGIELKPEQLAKIESAVNQAEAKGAKDSLILMQDMALIINVKNRMVVTAMDGSSMQNNVFTKIDSAVIVS